MRSSTRSRFGAKKRVVRKTTTRKVVPKTLKTQAKKHGIKLTVKRGDKRVPKSATILRKQLKTKMKTKKSSSKSSRTKPKRKSVRKTRFGKLEVPTGMKSVSKIRDQSRFLGREPRPLLVAPFGPPQRWLLKDETPAYSGAPAFGRRTRRTRRNYGFGAADSLEGKRVNPSGYLSTWYGAPRVAPPSWNYNLLQGSNNFREGVNSPTLSNVGTGFGKPKPKPKPRKTHKPKSKTRKSKPKPKSKPKSKPKHR